MHTFTFTCGRKGMVNFDPICGIGGLYYSKNTSYFFPNTTNSYICLHKYLIFVFVYKLELMRNSTTVMMTVETDMIKFKWEKRDSQF